LTNYYDNYKKTPLNPLKGLLGSAKNNGL